MAASAVLSVSVVGQSMAQSYVLSPGTIAGYTGAANVLQIGNNELISQTTETNFSSAFGISGDGSTLVGVSNTAAGVGHAFTWTGGAGFTDLGALTAGGRSIAMGTNGSTTVGFSDVAGGDWHAFVYTPGGGMVDLGTLATGNAGYSVATAISADGTKIVGAAYTDTTIDRATLWTNGVAQNLGVLPGGSAGYSDAYGISSNGNVVVGWSTTTGGFQHAFQWTSGGGMIDLGTIGGATGQSVATAANTDGSVIVGQSITPGGVNSHAAMWTNAGAAQDLGTISGGNSIAFGVSGNGGVVVGASDFGGGTHAFYWTQPLGMQDLNSVMTASGVNMTGVTLTNARGVSTNGQFIAGTGTFPGSGTDGYAYLARVTPGATGVTTFQSVLDSILQLSNSRTQQIVTNRIINSVLLGKDEQINGCSCTSGFGSLGSASAGAHGRYALSDNLTVLGGVSYSTYSGQGFDVSSSPEVAGSLRYDFVQLGSVRPYLEVGGSAAPWTKTTYTRSYLNGAGQATGVASALDASYTVFGSVGYVFRLSPTDEFGVSSSLSHNWQIVGAYGEATGNSNPFDAQNGGGTDQSNIVTFGGQYTHLFGTRVETTMTAGWAHSFQNTSGLNMTVTGFGAIPAPSVPDSNWAELGARIGYRFSNRLVADAFVNAAVGAQPIGTSVHGGLGLRYNFAAN